MCVEHDNTKQTHGGHEWEENEMRRFAEDMS